jgi:hypothetical protein
MIFQLSWEELMAEVVLRTSKVKRSERNEEAKMCKSSQRPGLGPVPNLDGWIAVQVACQPSPFH